MKTTRFFLIATLSFITLGFGSCVKDWNCQCKSLGYTTNNTISQKSHKDAKVACENTENTLQFVDASSSCSLK